jgi:hypothetical protein
MTTNTPLPPAEPPTVRSPVRRRFPLGVVVGLAAWAVYYYGRPLMDGLLGRMPFDLTARTVGIPLLAVALIVLLRRRASVLGIAVGLLIPPAALAAFFAAFYLECSHTQCFTF